VQAEREAFQLTQYLRVVRAYSDPTQQQQQQGAAGGSGGASGSKPKQKKKQKGSGSAAAAAAAAGAAGDGIVHFLPEAECYQAAAEWSFTLPAPPGERQGGQDELQPCRCVMLVKAAQAAAARRQLATLMKQVPPQ
jgi:hypothetical protein